VLEPLAMYAEGEIVPALSVPAKVPEGCISAAAAESAVVIHPGSGSPRKNWPMGKFLELAGIAAADGCGNPVFLFGEADAESRDAYRRAGAGWPVIEGLDICAVAGMLAACRGYVGNDSGISHLAAALGLPSVVLFGPSDPAVWGPRGRAVRLLRADPPTSEGLGGIAADRVAEELARAVSGARQPSGRASVNT
jgi:ADP-heptose:LPS heptosyltransferase